MPKLLDVVPVGRVNWNDRESVIRYAQSLARCGVAQVVYKRSDRNVYNICHAENWPLRLLFIESSHGSVRLEYAIGIEPGGKISD
jgi:hypothetical protein